MSSNCTLIKVFDDAESEKHNKKFARQLEHTVLDIGARLKNGAQQKH